MGKLNEGVDDVARVENEKDEGEVEVFGANKLDEVEALKGLEDI